MIKRHKKFFYVILSLGILLLLFFFAEFVFLWFEGVPRLRFKDISLNYVEYSRIKPLHVDFEDDDLKRKIIFASESTGEEYYSYSIMHNAYKSKKNEAKVNDPRMFGEIVSKDRSAVSHYVNWLTYELDKAGATNSEKVRRVISEVQVLDSINPIFIPGTDSPRRFIETLYECGGNSGDKSMMLCSMLQYLGYKTALLYDENEKIAYTGIALEESESCPFVEYNGERYASIDVCVYGQEIGNTGIDTKNLKVIAVFGDERCNFRYHDERRPTPTYSKNENDVISVSFPMKRWFMHPFANVEFSFSRDDYDYYSSLPRYDVSGYTHYLSDPVNNEEVGRVVNKLLNKYTDEQSSEWDRLTVLINFVHSIPYVYDIEAYGVQDYAQYPIETLCRHGGDCEDHAILMAAMLKTLGYDCYLAYYLYDDADKESESHAFVVVKDKAGIFSGAYYEIDGEKYYTLEATSLGRTIGVVDDLSRRSSGTVIQVIE